MRKRRLAVFLVCVFTLFALTQTGWGAEESIAVAPGDNIVELELTVDTQMAFEPFYGITVRANFSQKQNSGDVKFVPSPALGDKIYMVLTPTAAGMVENAYSVGITYAQRDGDDFVSGINGFEPTGPDGKQISLGTLSFKYEGDEPQSVVIDSIFINRSKPDIVNDQENVAEQYTYYLTRSEDVGPTEPTTSDVGSTEPTTSDVGPTEPTTSDVGPTEPTTSDVGPTEPTTSDPSKPSDQTDPSDQTNPSDQTEPSDQSGNDYIPSGGGDSAPADSLEPTVPAGDIEDTTVPQGAVDGENLDDGDVPAGPADDIVYKPFISGYPDGSVKPDNGLTRAEIAQIIYNLYGEDEAAGVAAPQYGDIEGDFWAANAIGFCQAEGLMIGYPDGNFVPDRVLTRAELCTTIVRVHELISGTAYEAGEVTFSDVVEGYWATDFISRAVGGELVVGYEDGTFKPDGEVTRAETAAVVIRMAERDYTLYDTDREFADLPAEHWGYDYVMNAANGYNYDE